MSVEDEIDKLIINKPKVSNIQNDNVVKNPIKKDLGSDIFSSIVRIKDNSNDTLGKDLQEITKQFIDDKNVFRFGNIKNVDIGNDALLGAIGDKPRYDPTIKPRYEFVKYFRYHLSVNRSAVESRQADRFKDIVSSLLGFRSLLEYRSAGMSDPLNEKREHNLMDKLKK